MNVKEAVYQRRAIKHFDANFQIPEQQVREMLETTLQSPTSFNIQHWRFIRLTDRELRRQVRALAFDQPHITEASELILLTGDVKAWQKNPERYWRNAPPAVIEFMLGLIPQFHEGREQLQHDEAMRSIGIAAATLMLVATEMGYETCPTIGYDHEKVAALIALPHDHIMGPFIAIGKKTKEPWPKPGPLPYEEVVLENRFPSQ